MKKTPLLMLIALSVSVRAEPLNDSTVVLSTNSLNYFITAAECLSIKATKQEKESLLTARNMSLQWDVNSGQLMSKEWLSEYISAEDKDRQEVYQAIKKYCPRTSQRIIASVTADGFSSSPVPGNILADLIIKAIAIDILKPNELRTFFEHENQATGLADTY